MTEIEKILFKPKGKKAKAKGRFDTQSDGFM